MAVSISVTVYKNQGGNNYSAASTIVIGTGQIKTVEPYVVPASGQPISGVVLASVIKLVVNGLRNKNDVYASASTPAAIQALIG